MRPHIEIENDPSVWTKIEAVWHPRTAPMKAAESCPQRRAYFAFARFRVIRRRESLPGRTWWSA